MTYFVEEIVGSVGVENQNAEHVIFRNLNATKFYKHSANKIIKNNVGEVIAIRCNCDKKVYHPAMEDKVFWSLDFSKKEIRTFRQKSVSTTKLIWALQD